MKRSGLLLCGVAATAFAVPAAKAQDHSADAAPAAIFVDSEEITAMRNELEALRAANRALEQRLDALEALSAPESRVLDPAEQAAQRGTGLSRYYGYRPQPPVLIQDEQTAAGASPQQEEEIRREPAQAQSVATVIADEQGVFGERFSFEAGVSYAHFDDARLNLSGFLALDSIFLGRISLDESSSDVVTFDATARYGITDRWQVDVNVPFLYRDSQFQSGGAGGAASGLSEAGVTASGLGDISVGTSYRLFTETLRRPDVVLNARIKAPTGEHPYGIPVVEVPGSEGNLIIPADLSTGNGVWSASIGASVLKTLDPMIVFANVTYFQSFAEKFDDVDEAGGLQPGTINLGEAVQIGAGVAYALNERSSLSMSVAQRFVERTTLKQAGQFGAPVVGSDANVAQLNLGATFAINEHASVIANVGVGMTTDAPDAVFTLRVPFTF